MTPRFLMTNHKILSALVSFVWAAALFGAPETLKSPDGRAAVAIETDEAGRIVYSLSRDGRPLLARSGLGFTLKNGPALNQGFEIVSAATAESDSTWTPVYGQFKTIRDHYRELRLDVRRTADDHTRLEMVFRIYDDGLAFRYTLPKQPGLEAVEIAAEHTEFNFAGNYTAWWSPINFELQEEFFRESMLSHVPQSSTPLTVRAHDGTHLAVHEAGLLDYAGMALKHTSSHGFTSELAPWPDGVKVRSATPVTTPWRTIQFSDRAGGLIESNLLLNLNEPCRIADVSWIKPTKYMGIWWSIHLGFETFEVGPHHGATTEKTRRMIDACARFGVGALLVEGWNKGWELRSKREDIPDFTTPTDDYDLPALARYAHESGVQLIVHHETLGNIAHYESHMEEAFAYCRSFGLNTVKGGYAGTIKPLGQLRQGQFMLNHYRRQIEQAAAQGVMLDVHEPAKFVGFGRTYPNLMTGEAVHGLEFEAWDTGAPPEHTVTIPFTRGLAGPVDYNFGIFDLKFERLKGKDFNWRSKRPNYPKNPGPCVQTTLAKQLALFVVIYSPMQMLPDLPENYDGHPAFKFLQDVPVDWDDTRVLTAEIGDQVTIARKGKGTEDWFIGSVTDEEARTLSVPLDFLDSDRAYLATIYADAPEAHWDTNPGAYAISTQLVNRDTVLTLQLAPGGGQAISLTPQ